MIEEEVNQFRISLFILIIINLWFTSACFSFSILTFN